MKKCLIPMLLLAAVTARADAQDTARGFVYMDANANAVRDGGEAGIPGVLVANGRDVAVTDAEGAWSLPVTDDTALFVVKPTDFAVPVDTHRRPRYHYLHKPAGSPPGDPAPGVDPTGPLPGSVDFGLIPRPEPRAFDMVVFSDPQARGVTEVNYVARDVVPELVGTDAAFGVTLGDTVADDPGLFREVSEAVGTIGIPWYWVFGNHDGNRSAKEDRHADETFERFFGPATYAFWHGGVFFFAFRNMELNAEGKFEYRFRADDLALLRACLERVPQEALVVLMMHVPLPAAKNCRELYALVQDRPRVFSMSGHTHEQAHLFLGESRGWRGAEPHHHYIAGTVSGAWWVGEHDETGIPHATMNDGGPNGYAVVSFDGADYRIRYKAARRPADYQMNIYCPDEVTGPEAPGTEVTANFFAGSERCRLDMTLDGGASWLPMERFTGTDPECARMQAMNPHRLDGVWGWDVDEPSRTGHLWRARLPEGMKPGTHLLTVRATDLFGQTHTGHRVIRILETPRPR